MSSMPSVIEIIEEFKMAMAENDIVTNDDIVADGKLQRFHVVGDAPRSRNGWAILHADERPAGQFGCNKRYGDERIGWSSKKVSKFTPEQRREYAQRMEKQKQEKEAAQAQLRDAAAFRAQAVWDASAPARGHPYLERKGVKAHGIRIGRWEIIDKNTGEMILITDQALLVPICDRTRKIRSLQGIFPSKLMGARDKDYLKDGEKSGLFHVIGKPVEHNGKRVFILAEGYSTAASVHETTGHCVMVCFDTSNLLHVAEAIRDRQPDALILIAADNDLGITSPVSNPGVYYAGKAAEAVGGWVVVPPFTIEDGTFGEDGKWSGPTDFNDLHARDGADAVKAVFDAVLNTDRSTPVVESAPWEESYSSDDEDERDYSDHEPIVPAAGAVESEGDHDNDELSKQAGFTILGYDQSDYYLFHHKKQQVMCIRKGDITDVGLVELQEPMFWEYNFANSTGGFDKKAIANWIFSTAHARGIYDPTRIRGRGAWMDKGRLVFHYGNHLSVDGEFTPINGMASGYVYPLGRSMPKIGNAMSDEEGQWLASVAKKVRWTRDASALLLCGWAMLAPICGALSWRPHIWLLGAAGSGKSTVQSKFLGALLRDVALYAQGDSTEPGIRQNLKADALPVLIDEIESNNENDKRRTESIIGMVRKTSSESHAKTYKGSASGDSMSFQIRSMFCLASINANLPTKADIDRLTRLTIRPPDEDRETAKVQWSDLEGNLNKIDEDEEISSRLMSRAISMLPIIYHNVAVFRKFCAGAFSSQRDGDQFGTLLAGYYSLTNSTKACEYDVREMIAGFDFGEHVEDHDQDDATKALETILSSKIRLGGSEFSVFELIRESVVGFGIGIIDSTAADQALKRHGIRVESSVNELWFGTNTSTLKELVANKPFVTDLRGQLLRVTGASRVEQPKKFNGMQSRCVAIPLMPILKENERDSLPV